MVTEVTIKGSVANTLAGLPLQPVAEAADKQEADKEGELAEGEAGERAAKGWIDKQEVNKATYYAIYMDREINVNR